MAQPRGKLCRAHGGEGITLKAFEPGCQPRHHPEGEEDGDRAHVGDDQVEKRGPPVFRLFVLVHDQEVGGGGHQLPGDQEKKGVVRQDDQEHAGDEERVKDDKTRDGPVPQKAFDIADGVNGDEKGEQADDQRKNPAKRSSRR